MMVIPLFPLAAVLFPGGLMPLRIFEPRYLRMVRQCHESASVFGLIATTQYLDPHTATNSYSDIGTMAEIIDFRQQESEVFEITCQGTQRFRVQSAYQSDDGLWMGEVEPVAGDFSVEIPTELKYIAYGLSQLIQVLKDSQIPVEKMPLPAQLYLDDCGWVANRWCELLSLQPQVKQHLMTLDNPIIRLELVGDFLAEKEANKNSR